ncbi:translation elongation factor Ts [Patescibacteria group bacterium]|nr:translation elongation factor Ts [Patescibacteria group bacterium]
MKINARDVKKLRKISGAGVMDCKKALIESKGDFEKASVWIKKKGMARADKRADRQVKAGLIESYSHNNGQVIGVVELACETDFVALNEGFKSLAHDLAMQVAAMQPGSVDELLAQTYIKNSEQTVGELVKEAIGKIGENIVVRRVARFELGEKIS